MRSRPLSRRYNEERIRNLIRFAVSVQSRADTVRDFLSRPNTRGMCERALHSLGLARYFLAFVVFVLSVLSSAAQGSYQVYQDTESGTPGNMITTTMLTDSLFTNGLYLTASINPSPHTFFYLTNQHDEPLRGSIFVGNTYFNGSGHGNTYCVRANGTVDRYCRFDIPNSGRIGQFAVGYNWRFSPTTDLSDFVDTSYIHLTSGDFAVAAFRDDAAPNKAIRIHTVTGVGGDIAVTSNTTYWVTILVDTNNGAQGTAKMAVFDRSTWRIVGISSLAFTTRGMVDYFKFGCLENHTINSDFRMFYDDFIVETGPAAAAKWPLRPAGATVTAASVSRANFDAAYTNAVSGAGTNKDIVDIPSGSATWTSGYTVAKTNLVIKGAGTNNTTITGDNGSSIFNVWTYTGSLCTMSNLTVTGDGSNDEVDGIHNQGYYNRFAYLWLKELNVAVYAEAPGLIDNSVMADSHYIGRNIFGNAFYNTFYPLDWNSTNFFVYEDNLVYWTSGKNASGSEAVFSSQQGGAFVIRNNGFFFNKASTTVQPVVDMHGDSPGLGRPITAAVVASNYFNDVIGTSISGSKFVDARGSRIIVQSNKWVVSSFGGSEGVVFREEDVGASPNYLVNNSFCCENYHGLTGTTLMPVNDDANITAGVDYFTTCVEASTLITYPHPLRNQPAAGGGGSPPNVTAASSGRVQLIGNARLQ